MNLPFQVICINDQHRPADFPSSKWIKKGESYTVIKIRNHVIQGGTGFVLEEIDMSDCGIYQAFGSWRFAVPGDITELEEVLEKEMIERFGYE